MKCADCGSDVTVWHKASCKSTNLVSSEPLPNNLVTFADIKNDGNLISPEVLLIEAAQEIRTGEMVINPNKAIAIFLEQSEGKYAFKFRQCGMSCSEMIALLDLMKERCRDMMAGRA